MDEGKSPLPALLVAAVGLLSDLPLIQITNTNNYYATVPVCPKCGKPITIAANQSPSPADLRGQ